MTPGIHYPRWLGMAVSVVLALSASRGPAVAGEAHAAPLPELGRLFLTPEQRRMLDAERARPSSKLDSGLPGDLLPARAAERRVVLSGVLRRGEGESVVWVNGRQADAAALARGRLQMRHGPDAQNRVTLESGDDGAVARLKPGQAWDPVSGDVTDCIQCGAPQAPAVTPPVEPAAAAAPSANVPAAVPAPAVAAATPTANPAAGDGKVGGAVNGQPP